ncbi:MAG: arsenate reductase family protein [Verrucomicrobiaceae bacterium]|nr:arsenate reductase family protein [Verrucomicrobiaceae bacterium]
MKLYTYAKCDTCRKATKWLRDKGFDFEEIPIRETPPSPAELREMLAIHGGELKRLCNTSGQDYRALGMKDKLPSLSEDEAIALLAGNGNLIKRPFLLDGTRGLVGFREEEWAEAFL